MTWMISASGSIYNPSVYIRVMDSDLQPSLACYNDVVSVYDGTYYYLYIYHFNWQIKIPVRLNTKLTTCIRHNNR